MGDGGEIPEGGFQNQEQLESWLAEQPHKISSVVVVRTVLSVLPVFSGCLSNVSNTNQFAAEVILPSFRALAASFSATLWPSEILSSACVSADRAANIAAQQASITATSLSGIASAKINGLANSDKPELIAMIPKAQAVPIHAKNAAYVAYSVAWTTSAIVRKVGAKSAVEASMEAIGFAAKASNQKSIYDRLSRIARAVEGGDNFARLSIMPFWPDGDSEKLNVMWNSVTENLLTLDEDWQVWTDWYEARLRGDPLNKELEIARVTELTEEDWEKGAKHVNAKIKAIIERFEKDDLVSAAEPDKNNDAELEFSGIEPQTIGALQFRLNKDGLIDADPSATADELAHDQNAQDRHAETVRFANKLKNSVEAVQFGDNSDQELLENVLLLLDALGGSIRVMRPGLLIPRGDALRQLRASNAERNNYSDLPPLPDEISLALDNLMSAYNHMVALDPVLSRADEALLGPDAGKNLVAPNEGMAIARQALEAGMATEAAIETLSEEAKIAPEKPDAENRISRRFSEGVKNFGRTVLAELVSGREWVKRNPIKTGGVVVGSLSGGTILLAKWMLANQTWFLGVFAHNPAMLQVIEKVIAFLKTLPLG